MNDPSPQLPPDPLPPPVPVRLTVLPSHPCPYLPDRTATLRAFATDRLDPAVYHRFMDAGFRRSGRMVYQPVCQGCRACVPIRVPVDRFAPDKSQRRCGRRNADLTVTVGRPVATDERFDLYRRYVTQWHGKPVGGGDDGDSDGDGDDRGSFESFLYDSPVDTLEFSYRDAGGRLLAVGIADVCEKSLSSVYFYYDPDHRSRGLGTFGALYEIGWAREANIPHYYLGFFVDGCRKMAYKADFRAGQFLAGRDLWTDTSIPCDKTYGGT